MFVVASFERKVHLGRCYTVLDSQVDYQQSQPPPLRGCSHMKRTGVLIGLNCLSPLRSIKILFCGCSLKCLSPLRGTNILFCGCGLKCFSPLRGTNILFCGCGLKCFKRYQDPVLWVWFEMFVTPKRY